MSVQHSIVTSHHSFFDILLLMDIDADSIAWLNDGEWCHNKHAYADKSKPICFLHVCAQG